MLWRWLLRHGREDPWWDEWIAYRVLYGRHAAFIRPMASRR